MFEKQTQPFANMHPQKQTPAPHTPSTALNVGSNNSGCPSPSPAPASLDYSFSPLILPTAGNVAEENHDGNPISPHELHAKAAQETDQTTPTTLPSEELSVEQETHEGNPIHEKTHAENDFPNSPFSATPQQSTSTTESEKEHCGLTPTTQEKSQPKKKKKIPLQFQPHPLLNSPPLQQLRSRKFYHKQVQGKITQRTNCLVHSL